MLFMIRLATYLSKEINVNAQSVGIAISNLDYTVLGQQAFFWV